MKIRRNRALGEKLQHIFELYGYQNVNTAPVEYKDTPVRFYYDRQKAMVIGMDSIAAEAEMIAMAVDSLKKIGISEFQLRVGSVDFRESLLEEAAVSDSVLVKTALQIFSELTGDVNVLKEAKKIALNNRGLESVKRLEALYELLVCYEVENYIVFDLGLELKDASYTGIVFANEHVEGGRCMRMVQQTGKEVSAVAVAFADEEQEVKNTYVLYDESRALEAVSLARSFRKNGKHTEIVMKEKNISLEKYVRSARRNLCVTMLYLRQNGDIEMLNVVTGKRKSISKKIK